METTNYILIGGGGHARVLSSIIEAQKDSQLLGIFDNNRQLSELDGIKNFIEYTPDIFPKAIAIIAIGDNLIRQKHALIIKHSFGRLVYPSAAIDSLCSLGHGTVVMHQSCIQRGTQIGNHGIINTASIIDHDCVLGDFVHIAPNATLCGGVHIGHGTLIGAGVTVIPNIKIGNQVTVGAGTVVTKDIPHGAIVVGNPGKIIKSDGEL
tara:strand:- start:169 stop:792 length:624 start_codon:yes stop_codon:yes gene_type:complete